MRELKPCGTEPAYRRHLRHHEPPCPSCAAANRNAKRACVPSARVADLRPVRNNLAFIPYRWRDPARISTERLAELQRWDELEALLAALYGTPEGIAS